MMHATSESTRVLIKRLISAKNWTFLVPDDKNYCVWQSTWDSTPSAWLVCESLSGYYSGISTTEKKTEEEEKQVH